MNNVAIILARGGSKGIPNKNLMEIDENPLIYHVINCAINSKCDSVWVSSDSDDILKFAENMGSNIIKRPSKLSSSSSKSEEALNHFTKIVDYDNMIFIQPTSPLLKPKYINLGLDMMEKYDSVFSAYKEHWIPRWTLNNKPDDWDVKHRPMRQDVDEKWVENGAFYITSRDNFLKSGLRYSGDIGIVEMNKKDSFQIDDYDDIVIIEKMLRK